MTWRSRRTTDLSPISTAAGLSTGAHVFFAFAAVFTAAVLTAGGIIVGGVASTSAAAQTASIEPVRLAITGQSAVVHADGSFVVELDVRQANLATAEPGQYLLAATIFDRLRQEEGVDLQPVVPTARFDPVDITELERNPNNRFRLKLPIASAEAPDRGDAVVLDEAGVYPVTIDLSGPDGVVATTRTNLIRLPSDDVPDTDGTGEDGGGSPSDPAPTILGPVAVILSVSAGGTVDPGGPESELTVDQAAEILTALPDLPIGVLLEADALAALGADPGQAETLAQAIGDRPLFVGPTINLDPSALAEVGQGHIFRQAVEQNWAQARSLGLNPDTTVTIISRQLTADGVEALAETGIATAIDVSGSSATNDVARSGDVTINLIRFEENVSSGFRAGDTGSLTANRALARLVLRYQADRSPVVLRADSRGVDKTNGLGVLLRWIDLLAKQGRADTAMATEIEPSTVRRLAERPNQNLEVHRQLLGDLNELLASFSTMYDLRLNGADETVAPPRQPAGQTTPHEYRRWLRSALTVDQTPQERHRSLLLFSESLAGEIEVLALPVTQPVTMAASVGEVPVIIESRAAGPRRVMLQFRSDKVIVEQDRQVVVLDPGISSIDVRVQARTLGSSQLQMSVWTPDGEQMLASNQFQIRSTAVPGLGVLISVVAIALLLVWWYLDHRRRKHQSAATHPTVVDVDEIQAGAETPPEMMPGRRDASVVRSEFELSGTAAADRSVPGLKARS